MSRSASVGRLAAVVVLSTLAAAGCGYNLAGRGPGVLPESVKSIAVVPFENRTTRPEIEQRITEAVALQLTRRGGYRVVTDRTKADAVLDGAVVEYRTVPVQFTPGGRGNRVEAEVRIQATLRDTSDDKVLWSQSGLIFRRQYDVPESGDFFDQETVALDELATGAAGVLVTSIVEGF